MILTLKVGHTGFRSVSNPGPLVHFILTHSAGHHISLIYNTSWGGIVPSKNTTLYNYKFRPLHFAAITAVCLTHGQRLLTETIRRLIQPRHC